VEYLPGHFFFGHVENCGVLTRAFFCVWGGGGERKMHCAVGGGVATVTRTRQGVWWS
jgi:hypothetical protein